ncbi:MAG: purine-nucleoside phosphorylase [Cyclobacteriaceae bacterium]|nr:purine-nucleoside phosphorylase [Cyclobacteriaceae bacterium]
METLKAKIEKTKLFLNENGILGADVAVILGTGIGNAFLERIDIKKTLDYSDIPGFPVATVEFHKGKLILAELHGKQLLVFQGRFHYYEGYSMQEITFPVRIAKALGCKHLLLSNAAGGINLEWNKGDLMLVDDHINLQPGNPLRGPNDETLGPRFVDMVEPYNLEMNQILKKLAGKENIVLREGVYAAVSGPHLETRAEYRYMRTIGADAVGMSTVPEVLVANHAGIPCAAISMITDECDPDNLQPINIPEIMAIAKEAEVKIAQLFAGLIERLG